MAHTKKGIVALLDILGYQSFLENNEPSTAVDEVLKALIDAPTYTKNHLKDVFAKHEEIVHMVDSMQPLIFSDSILLTLADATMISRDASSCGSCSRFTLPLCSDSFSILAYRYVGPLPLVGTQQKHSALPVDQS